MYLSRISMLLFIGVVFISHAQPKEWVEKAIHFENEGMADSLYITLDLLADAELNDGQLLAYRKYYDYFRVDSDYKTQALREAIQLADGAEDKVLMAKAYLRLGRLKRRENQTDSVAFYYLKALENVSSASTEKTLAYLKDVWAEALYTLSAFYHQESRYEKGIEYGLEAIIKSKETDNEYLKLTSHVNLSAIYGELASEDNVLGTQSDRDRYKKLLGETTQKAIEYAEKLPKETSSGWAYLNYATFLTEDENWDSALQHIRSAIKIFDFTGKLTGQALAYDLMGNYFKKKQNIDSAFYYFHRASDFAKASNSPKIIAETKINLGYLSLSSGDTSTAEMILKEAAALAEENLLFREALQANLALSEIAEKKNQSAKALAYFKKFSNFQDSAVSEKNYAQIEKLRTQFETEKKEVAIRDLTTQNEIQELQLSQRNLLLWIVAIAFLSSVIIGYLIYNQRLVRKHKEANDLKQKLLRVQLNPHFMFNSLNAIQNLVYKNTDKQKTADYLARFSHLTRQILELNQHDFITLEDEVRFIENYLTIQQIRFDEPFQYTIEVDDEIDRDGTLIPPMITQPFLENAIEHGIINKSGKGEILLKISAGETHMHIVIEDNGVGRDVAAFEKRTKKHRSMATQITLDRLENLQRSFRKQASMTIEDITNAGLILGTRVLFKLPLKREE